jgi:salicylate---[aryl-carrier protein] ligase
MTRVLCPIDGVIYSPANRADRLFENGSWVRSTVGDALRETAQRFPDRAALVGDDRTITFAELGPVMA